MAFALPNPNGCCQESCSDALENVPGSQGDAGTNGVGGADGINAFTNLTAGFVQPAANVTVVVEVDDSTWATVGQIVFVQFGGYYEVTALTNSTHMTLENLNYTGNLVPTTAIPNGSSVSPGGLAGPTGPAGAASTLDDLSPTTAKGDILADDGGNTPNSSLTRLGVGTNGKVLHANSGQATGLLWQGVDLAGTNTTISGAVPIANGGTAGVTAAAARTNLGLGTVAVESTVPIAKGGTGAVTAALARTALGLAIGTDVQAQGATLTSLEGLALVAGDTLYATAADTLQRLPKGIALQVLRMNGAATAPEWAASASKALQMVSTTYATYNSYTTAASEIPLDDTIPQIGEGNQILSLAITPLSATSRLKIEVSVPCTVGVGSVVIAALFTGGANAIAAAAQHLGSASNYVSMLKLAAEHSPGAVTPITFTVRVGQESGANTMYVNGNDTSRLFGGVMVSSLVITEFEV